MKQMLYNTKDRLKTVNVGIDSDPLNKEILMKYMNSCFAEGLSDHRIVKYLTALKILSKDLNKSFIDATKDDIMNLVAHVEQRTLSAWTKKDYKFGIKRFYKWLRQTDEFPSEVKWIKTTLKQKDRKLPTGLITEEDVAKMVEAATSQKYKTFVILLYESGARIGELANIKFEDITFDDYGTKVILDGKTGMRSIRIIKADPYLRDYINQHQNKDNPQANIWLANDVKTITHSAISQKLKEIAKRAGIKKDIHAHLYRHSRATILAQSLTQAELCSYMGWRQGSEMTQTYVHLSSVDLDKKMLKLNGMETEEDKKQEFRLAPKECPRCQKSNPFTNRFCTDCGSALDIKTAIELDEKRKESDDLMSKLMDDPQVKLAITNALSKKSK